MTDPIIPSSVTLEQILEAVLIDVAQAQDASNRYSAEILAPDYEADTLLKEFPVPNAYLSEMEVELRIAVNKVDTKQAGPETSVKKALYNTKTLTPYVIPVVERIKEILSSFFSAASNLTETEITEKLNIVQRNLLSDGFTEFLNKKITKALLDNEKVLLENFEFNAKTATQKIMQVVEKEIFNQQELGFIFGEEQNVRKRLEGLLRNPVFTILSKVQIPFEISGLKNQKPDMKLFVSTTDLIDVDSNIISSLKVKVAIRNYKWATDPNDTRYKILLPTTQ